MGMSPTERLKFRRHMAAVAGKKSTTSLPLTMEVYGLEVEEELSTMATKHWAEGVWIGKWSHEPKPSAGDADLWIQIWGRIKNGLAE